jgi:hypothetical protein
MNETEIMILGLIDHLCSQKHINQYALADSIDRMQRLIGPPATAPAVLRLTDAIRTWSPVSRDWLAGFYRAKQSA